jgi:hypothetical protein
MSKRITGEVKNKEGKVVGKIDYAQPESLQEAAGMFGEDKLLGGFNYWLGVAKRKEATKLPSIDKDLMKQLRKNPALLEQLKEKLGVK